MRPRIDVWRSFWDAFLAPSFWSLFLMHFDVFFKNSRDVLDLTSHGSMRLPLAGQIASLDGTLDVIFGQTLLASRRKKCPSPTHTFLCKQISLVLCGVLCRS